MSLAEEFFSLKGTLREEPYPLPSGGRFTVREIGADTWLLIKLASYKHRTDNWNPKEQSVPPPDLLYDARVLAHSVINGDGKPVFDPDDESILTALSKEPARTFDPLMAVVNRVNSTGDEQHETLKKTFESAPNSTSSDASPETSES